MAIFHYPLPPFNFYFRPIQLCVVAGCAAFEEAVCLPPLCKGYPQRGYPYPMYIKFYLRLTSDDPVVKPYPLLTHGAPTSPPVVGTSSFVKFKKKLKGGRG